MCKFIGINIKLFHRSRQCMNKSSHCSMICLKNSEVNEHQSKKRAQFLVAYDLLSKDEHISLRYIYNAELFNTQSLH